MTTYYSHDEFLNEIEGAIIVTGEIHADEGITLYLQDGRALIFVSDSFALALKRMSTKGLH